MKYIAPITALVITMTALTLAIIGKNSMIGYDIAKKISRNIIRPIVMKSRQN